MKKMSASYITLADTHIVNVDGRTVTFDDIIDRTSRSETVLNFHKGHFGLLHLNDVELYLEDDAATVYHVELTSGEKFTVLERTRVLSSNNEWVNASDLTQGDGLKTLTYRPSVRHPQLTPKVVAKVTKEELAFAPVVTFAVTESDNFLLSTLGSAEDCNVLIPVCPKQLQTV